jgi:rhamnose utilization protein RhaD (predicted bifunctional aldolase and dehydrogenase)
MRRQLQEFSASVGNAPLLVQGAGGNISWKDSDLLWIKASGTWLAEAMDRDIFVALERPKLAALLKSGTENFAAAMAAPGAGRPSIETSLHALLPHRIVLHVHLVDAIARMAQMEGGPEITRLLDGLEHVTVPYAKPGVRLSENLRQAIDTNRSANIFLLENHGVVLGADSLDELRALLDDVAARMKIEPRCISPLPEIPPTSSSIWIDWKEAGYEFSVDAEINALAVDPVVLEIVRKHWVLYPDHAVFLGGVACVVDAEPSEAHLRAIAAERPAVVFVEGVGVLERADLTPGAHSMLRCFHDVVARIPQDADIRSLSAQDVSELLDWDAEKYRQSLALRHNKSRGGASM